MVLANPSSARNPVKSLRTEAVTVEKLLEVALQPLGLRTVVRGRIVLITAEESPKLPGPAIPEIHRLTRSHPEAEACADRLLEATVDLDVESLPLRTSAKVIAEQGGFSFEADPDVGDRPVGKLQLKNVPAAMALRLMCLQAGADWTIDAKGMVRISRLR